MSEVTTGATSNVSAPITTSTETVTAPVGGLEGNGQVATPVQSEAATVTPTEPAAKVPEAQKTEPPAEKPVATGYALKIPEGAQLKAEHVEQVKAFAKQNNLSVEHAQALLDRDAGLVKAAALAQEAQFQKQVDDWKQASINDPEFGGEKLGENAELGKRAIERFGGEGLKKILNDTGYGNHPEVIRAFSRIGKAMAEGKIVSGGGNASADIPFEDRFYGKKT